MFRRNDISATDKLIRIIREDDDPDTAVSPPPPVSASYISDSSSFTHKILSYWKKATIGIDIGYDRVQFVKIIGNSDQNRSIEDCLSVPFDPQMATDKKRFSAFLKAHLRKISGFSRQVELWVAIPPKEMDIRYLEIPTVPKKQIPKAVYWTFHKKNPIEKEEHLFDFEVLENHSRKVANKTSVVAFSIPRQTVQEYRNSFSKINLSLKGISASPFAFQNLLKHHYLLSHGQSVCCLHIGMTESRIDLFFPDGTLALSRKIRACVKHMIDDIQKGLSAYLQDNLLRSQGRSATPVETTPVVSKLNLFTETSPGVSRDQALDVLTDLINPVSSFSATMKRLEADLEESDVLEMLIPALKRITWRVERTIEDFCTEIGAPEVGTLYLSGKISACPHVVTFLERQFEFPREVKLLDPFAENRSPSESGNIPQDPADRNSLGGALGMALSRNLFTPNFLFSHTQKEKYRFHERLHKIVLSLLFLISVVLLGIFLWQDTVLNHKNEKIVDLRHQLESKIARNGRFVDSPLIEQQIESLQKKRKAVKEYAGKYLSIAVIREISVSLPPEIRLLNLEADIHPDSLENTGGKKEAGQGQVSLEGIVTGEPLHFETTLIHFISTLKNKPIFGSPTLEKKSRDEIEGEKVLRFFLIMDIL